MRAWIWNGENTGADVDKVITSTANSIAEHLKTNWSQKKADWKREGEDSLF